MVYVGIGGRRGGAIEHDDDGGSFLHGGFPSRPRRLELSAAVFIGSVFHFVASALTLLSLSLSHFLSNSFHRSLNYLQLSLPT